jgi:ribulose-5-phosphate 4-epimerase/fuculose-1-phosphate aldolase
MPDPIEQVKKELLACTRRAYTIGLQTGNVGNLSACVAGTDKVVIKGSGHFFGECTLDNLVTVNLDGEIIEGPGKRKRLESPTTRRAGGLDFSPRAGKNKDTPVP